MENIIVLKQEPIISYNKIEEVGKEVQKRISDLNIENLVATEDTIQAVKSTRTDLNKEFAIFEEQRKLIKKAVEAPYKEFEDKYKEFIATHYNNADSVLKDNISRFENGLKQDKENEVKEYFTELVQSKNINFLPYEKIGLKVTLSASLKSLKEQVLAAVEQVEKDLDLVRSIPETQDFKDEVVFEYKKNFNISKSLRDVQERFKARKEAQERAEVKARKEEEEQPKSEPAETPKTEVLQAPKVEEQPQLLDLQFRVRGTKEQLVALKQFIISNNIQILD